MKKLWLKFSRNYKSVICGFIFFWNRPQNYIIQLVARPKATFKTTLPKKPDVYGGAVWCQQVLGFNRCKSVHDIEDDIILRISTAIKNVCTNSVANKRIKTIAQTKFLAMFKFNY